MNDDLLIQRYLDHRLSAEELVTLQRRLREDAGLREHLRTIAEQAVAFGDMARGEITERVLRPHVEPKPARIATLTWLALAASLAMLASGAWFFVARKVVPVLTLVESTGSVVWSDGTAIQAGMKLESGTLETVGEASTAQFRFADGTLLTLHGETELTFSEDGQKTLALSRGALSAQVQPQPAGRPMLIRTPSAVAEVVGTTFDLTTRPEDTWLKVNQGLVKLKRLADGSQIDVPANRSVVASLHTHSALTAAATPEPLTDWSFDFTNRTPPRDWRGSAGDGAMRASPYVAKKHADGSVTTHFGVSVRTAMLPQPLRLLALERSVLRFRLRQEQPGGIHLMLLTHKLDGGFGGNFEAHLRGDELHPGSDGWCEVAIPVLAFRPVMPHHPKADGHILTSVILFTPRQESGLSVSRFALATAS
jgi:hypothetical protein